MWWPELHKLPVPLCLQVSPPLAPTQSWYDEVKDYTYPYPHECNPWCPERCSGLMCTHYTQVGPGRAAWPQPGTLGFWGSPPVREPLFYHCLHFFPFNSVLPKYNWWVELFVAGSQIWKLRIALETSVAVLHCWGIFLVSFCFVHFSVFDLNKCQIFHGLREECGPSPLYHTPVYCGHYGFRPDYVTPGHFPLELLMYGCHLSDSLGHNQQDRLCREHLPEDECLGMFGKCSLPVCNYSPK